jgi:hypothetical protein
MYFLVRADTSLEAVSETDRFIETEHTLCDWYDLIDRQDDSLNEAKRAKLLELQAHYQPLKKAEEYFADALKMKAEGNLKAAGWTLTRAGGLWMGQATTSIPYYNITNEDFSIPEDTNGWRCITAVVHF